MYYPGESSDNICEMCDCQTPAEELNQYDGLCYHCHRKSEREYHEIKRRIKMRQDD